MFDYNDPRWQRKRLHILRRDMFLCQKCKRYGKHVPATMVHHIKEVEFYPELAYDDDNLTSLCDHCHNKEHPEKGKKNFKKRSPPV
jgi:5-methylcytosine-specific restriction endonuclease McrA